MKQNIFIIVAFLGLWSLEGQNAVIPKIQYTFDRIDLQSATNRFYARDASYARLLDWRIGGYLEGGEFPYGTHQPDRHNHAGKAWKPNLNKYVNFSYSTIFGGRYKYFGFGDASSIDALTISVWVKVSNPDDEDEKLIFGASRTSAFRSNMSDLKFGLVAKGKTLYLKQYYERKGYTGSRSIGVTWDYELYPPAAFDAGAGWYHVIAIFAKTQKYIRILVGKPNGGATYGPGNNPNVPGSNVVTREFDGRLIWIPGIKDAYASRLYYWFMGGTSKDLVFDDLMIFDTDLTFEQARTLFDTQKPSASSSRSGTAKSLEGRGSQNEALEEINEDLANNEGIFNGFKLIPNPTNGLVTISFSTIASGNANVVISSIVGKTVYAETFDVTKGNNQRDLDLESLGLPAGLYFVNLETPKGVEMKRKLILK